MKPSLRLLGKTVAILVVLIAVGVILIYSGIYNVAATHRHTQAVERIFRTAMMRSVVTHARDVHPPPNFNPNNPELAEYAAGHYEAMCRTCHGAPGKKPDPWQLYPPPPDLADALRVMRWSDPEVFWIIKNGVKDTGMSAFGGSHSDDDIWALTAFVRQLNSLPADQYRSMTANQSTHTLTGETDQQKPTPKSEPVPQALIGRTRLFSGTFARRSLSLDGPECRAGFRLATPPAGRLQLYQ